MAIIADICRMLILLAAATAGEIGVTRDFLQKNHFLAGPHRVEILLTGVGAVTTTYALTRAIDLHRPSLVIQAGIAGSFSPQEPGKVVAVNEDMFADLGVWEHNRFNSIFDMGLSLENQALSSRQILVNPAHALLEATGLPVARAITVNEITTDGKRIEWYNQNLQPVVESMEGAALHYVCLLEKIPFLQLRSVSNQVGERDKSKWQIAPAIEALNHQLLKLLKALASYNETQFRI